MPHDLAAPAGTSVDYGRLRTEFAEKGFVGPSPIFARSECRRIMRRLRKAPAPLDWSKGHAASARIFHDLSTHSEILDRVEALLGEDVMLWGASLVVRRPGQAHAWHTDLETSGETGRTVTVWVGLENTNRRSSLVLIPHSHRFAVSLQQVAFDSGKRRGEATTEDVVAWARQRDSRSGAVQLATGDGDALMFDGRLWHGSLNTNRWGTRTAVLLGFATPDTPIRIPDPEAHYEWPFRFLEYPRAPCIMVRGTDQHAINRMVAAPAPDRARASISAAPDADPIWPCWIKMLDPKLEEDERTGWNRYPIFRGSTRCMKKLSSHVSVLSAGIQPHPPHEHPEEELIVVLSGEAEIVKMDDTAAQTTTRQRIGPGSFVYHSAGQTHTIQSVGPEPATYLIFKWWTDVGESEEPSLQSSIFHLEDGATRSGSGSTQAMARTRIVDSQTRYLRRLRSHVTTLQPGAGYPPHRDPYDVAIVVFSGTVETLGHRVGTRGVIFYAAGEPHGMRNVGVGPAKYLVFEFHGGDYKPEFRPRSSRAGRRWWKRLRRLARRTVKLFTPHEA